MATTVQDIVTQAFFDLGATASGAAPSTSESADALLRLNQMIASWSTEGATVYTETIGNFAITAGQQAYTFGAGGGWDSTVRAQKIVAWKITSGASVSGGAPMPFAEFDMAAKAANLAFAQANAQLSGEEAAMVAQIAALEAALVAKALGVMAPFYLSPTFAFPVFAFPALALAGSAVPMFLGADTAYPLINVRVYPPAAAGASAEITYWTVIPAFAALTTVVALPAGFEDALHFNLGVALSPQYSRAGGIDPVLAAKAQQTKASIVAQNTIASQAPQQPSQPA